jgi:hypothetical protein
MRLRRAWFALPTARLQSFFEKSQKKSEKALAMREKV